MSIAAKTPSYVSFCQSIAADLRALGVDLRPQAIVIDGVEGNKGWACFQHAATEQKIYVSRTDAKLAIHTTLDLDPSTPGYIAPPAKPNGKIAAHYEADLAKVRAHLIPLFAGQGDRLRANRAPASRVASAQAEPTASELAALGL